MDWLLEFVPPGWFEMIWVAESGHFTTTVAEEVCVGELPSRERTEPAGRWVPGGFIELVCDPEFLETGTRESDIGPCNRN